MSPILLTAATLLSCFIAAIVALRTPDVIIGDIHDTVYDTFSTARIQQVLDQIPYKRIDNNFTYVIGIRPGTYVGQLHMIVPNVTIIGSGANNTILRWDHNSVGGFTTASALIIRADDITIERIGIVNMFAEPIVFPPYQPPPSPPNDTLVAVALAVYADRITFRYISAFSYQDTLLVNNAHTRQYFYKSIIHGRTDYIFGAGTAYFDQCIMDSLGGGFITAASTSNMSEFGLVFVNSTVVYNTTGTFNTQPIALGRSWHNQPTVTYINVTFPTSRLVMQRPWLTMDKTSPTSPCTSRFAEYHSLYADGDTNYTKSHPLSCESDPNVIIATTELSSATMKKYSQINVLSGWTPQQLKVDFNGIEESGAIATV